MTRKSEKVSVSVDFTRMTVAAIMALVSFVNVQDRHVPVVENHGLVFSGENSPNKGILVGMTSTDDRAKEKVALRLRSGRMAPLAALTAKGNVPAAWNLVTPVVDPDVAAKAGADRRDAKAARRAEKAAEDAEKKAEKAAGKTTSKTVAAPEATAPANALEAARARRAAALADLKVAKAEAAELTELGKADAADKLLAAANAELDAAVDAYLAAAGAK